MYIISMTNQGEAKMSNREAEMLELRIEQLEYSISIDMRGMPGTVGRKMNVELLDRYKAMRGGAKW